MSRTSIFILSLALLTGLFWVGFEAYHQNRKSTVAPLVQKQQAPLDPKLEVEVLEKLKGREPSAEKLPY